MVSVGEDGGRDVEMILMVEMTWEVGVEGGGSVVIVAAGVAGGWPEKERNAKGFNASLGENFEIQHAQPEDTHELLCKLIEDFQIISKELAEYINSPSRNRPTFYNNDEEHSIQYKEYLENYSNAIVPVLPTKEPEYSLSMGDEYLSTISKTESDKVIKSSVKNIVPILSEFEVTSKNESECDVPINDESSPIFTTFSNPLFGCNDDFTFSNDGSLSNEDVLMENFKIYSNPLFDDEEIISTKIDLHYLNAKSNLIESLLNQDTLIDSSPKFDYLLELTHIDPIPPGIEELDFDLEEEIRLVENLFDSQMGEIDLFLDMDDLIPPGNESDDYDSEGDIHFLEEFLNTVPLSENESSNFDHHNDLSFPCPPSKPPDVEILCDFELDTVVLTAKMVEAISEHHVLMPNTPYPLLKTNFPRFNKVKKMYLGFHNILGQSPSL
nr:hypothetical protein [Tanacetum cinerariifolium]